MTNTTTCEKCHRTGALNNGRLYHTGTATITCPRDLPGAVAAPVAS